MEWKINNSRFANLPGVVVNEYEGKEIDLLSVVELHKIQKVSPNTVLISIHGDTLLAIDANDDDRVGFSAYGILSEMDNDNKN